ncbi:hypothetical protein [Nocardioides deserti]|uniref:ABC transporter permease n=1 Tax=Nocardioides deserti TaxID=1588644 RepID=A0ABR6U401_9ACTN|nr:hypothetical protein [Nocardioides deserti]MBC2959127.1 hypothetical protein [Nocardioides deserti]GGO68633.1 ABC transporter [Nocardioides deserti]
MSARSLRCTAAAEWSRIWTVRSSWLLAGVTALVVLSISILVGLEAADDPAGVPADASAWDGGRPTAMFALFGVLALAVVASTADHGTGGIVPTLQWTPRRHLLLVARVGVIALTTSALGVLLVAGAGSVVWSLVPEIGLPARQGAEVLGGVAIVLAAGAVMAVGLGLLLRSTAGGLVSVSALVLVLPMLLAQLPYGWSQELATVMPGSGALFLVFGEGPSDDMTTTSARLTLAVWALGALLTGGARLLRGDADR